jgi:hypothetical protein
MIRVHRGWFTLKILQFFQNFFMENCYKKHKLFFVAKNQTHYILGRIEDVAPNALSSILSNVGLVLPLGKKDFSSNSECP